MRRPSLWPRRRGARLVAAAAVLCVGLGLAAVLVRKLVAPPAPAAPAVPAAAVAPPAGPLPPPPLRVETIVIRKGENLARLLKRQDFSDKEIHRLKESVKPVYDLARITAGHELRLSKSEDGAWKELEYDIDDARYLAVRNEAGGIRAEVKAYPFEFRPVARHRRHRDEPGRGHGQDSTRRTPWPTTWPSAASAGTSISTPTSARATRFRILVEKKFLDGKFAGYRNILAAEFVNEGKTFQAYRFIYPDTGAADYFDESGLSKRKEFLKSPFKYGAHVTSRFSASRLHPIYKVYRPHLGVDYGAPAGTPVQATADGKVTYAGWNDGSGQQVRLQHKNGYETLYSHLSRYGPGIQAGAQVRGGDVVGYVGMTGDATGPHLDYRIHYHGVPVNPLGQKFKPADPVRKEYREAYGKEVERLRGMLDGPGTLPPVWPRLSS